VATVDSIQQRGVPAELIAANVTSSRPCVVFASPGDGFPFAALEALARDTPVVASRTPTTTEILEGAVVLVESVAAGDIADAAVALATNDARRGLAIAAGRARAGDFSCQRRAPELVSVLRRALASR
jgi:glycosyltransferase involved in cell wall biosynthesis